MKAWTYLWQWAARGSAAAAVCLSTFCFGSESKTAAVAGPVASVKGGVFSSNLVVTLSGESEIELEGGRKLRLGPGHILLAEDTTGQGHISRAIGSQDRLSLFITLAPGAVPPR